MLSSNLNKQAQSGSPGAQTQLLSKWMRAGVPSAMLSTGNVLPINSDETGNNCKFDIPGLATSSFVFKAFVRNKISCQQDTCFCLCMSNTWHGLCFVTLDYPEEITIQPREAIEGHNITLTCRAARYLYTGLQWLDSLNQTITSNVSSLQLSSHSISLSLQLHNVSKDSTTGYKCQSYKLHKRVEVKSVALIVYGKLREDMRSISLLLIETLFPWII